MRNSSGGTARIAPTASIPQLLTSFGLEAEEVLDEAGIDPGLFNSPDSVISFRSRAHLLQICAQRTNCEHFGLLVGQQSGLSSFGLVGYHALHSPDVATALGNFKRHLHLHAQGALVELDVGNESTFLGYSIYEDNTEAVPHLLDASVAMAFNIMRELCGSQWKPSEVCFAHRMPEDPGPYRRFFGANPRFDAEHSGVYFPSFYMERLVPGADPELHRLLEKQLEELHLRFRDDFPALVRRVLQNAVLTGHTDANYVAAAFSIHSRTLHRRLKDSGVSFQEILDQCRLNLAKQMLGATDIKLERVADLLGYADTRALSRAFRRWTGTTPARWRKAAGNPQSDPTR